MHRYLNGELMPAGYVGVNVGIVVSFDPLYHKGVSGFGLWFRLFFHQLQKFLCVTISLGGRLVNPS